MIKIVEFDENYERPVIDLIVGIQRGEFGVNITAEEQPDLASIPEFYQTGNGNFWVALDEDLPVGTISLKDIGNDEVALRKMFVDKRYRGAGSGVAKMLLENSIAWAKRRNVESIYLGTTDAFRAAHRFYEKNGFRQIDKNRLPRTFPLMVQDTRFYWLKLSVG
jgi:GNAT superfamily N-acetyltransferase